MFSASEPDNPAMTSLRRAHRLLAGMAAALRGAGDEVELLASFDQLLREAGYQTVWLGDPESDRHAPLTLPLISGNARLGSLHLCAPLTLAIDDAERALLDEVAAQLAFGIATCRQREAGHRASAQVRELEEALRNNEERYRRIFQDGPLGMLTTGEDARFRSANAAICRMLGYTEEELCTMGFLDITHPDHRSENIEQVRRLRNGEIPVFRTEKRYLRKDGEVIWGAVTVSTVRDRDGTLLYTLAMVDDITARKEVEERLKMLIERFDLATRTARLGVWDWDIVQDYLVWDDGMYALYGLTPDTFSGAYEAWIHGLHPDDAAHSHAMSQLALKGEKDYDTEFRVIHPNGEIRYLKATALVIRDAARHPVRMIGINIDITEQKQTEVALRESEQLYRSLINAIPDGFTLLDMDGIITFVSPRITAVYGGRGMEDAQGTPALQWIAPEYHEKAIANLRSLLTNGTSGPNEYVLLRKDGSRFHGEISSALLTDEQGAPKGMITITRDVTARKQAEEALRASEEHLAVTLRSIGDGVIAVDTDGRVTLLNPVAEQLTGWQQQDAVGQDLSDVFIIVNENTREPRENPAEVVLRTGEAFEQTNHTLLVARDGVERVISEGASPIRDQEQQIIGAVLVFRDVTADARTQRELQRMARMDSLGVMAGGIAHDFNNLLTAIAGNVGLAQLSLTLQDQEELQRHLAEAEQAAIRARDLTMQLLTFAKGGAPQRTAVALAPLLQETVAFSLTGSRSRAQVTCAPDLWPIHADAGQISQTVQNLLLNADQATPGGGLIEVSADNVQLADDEIAPLPAGSYVRITVRDNGNGISPEIKEKIFDPFFTTKRVGSGLGLASVYSIVRSHDGLVTVDSQPGQGSAFTVFLPAQPRLAPQQIASTAAETAQASWRILVLDDEVAIREILQDVLEGDGHTVVTVGDGTQAIACWTEALHRGERFDLGIFDLTVPGGKGGNEVVAELRLHDPHLRAIASSGYANDPIMAHYQHYGFVERLAKPYRINDVLQMIAQLQKTSESVIE